MIRLKHLLAEQSNISQQAIQLIGDDVDLFVHNYIDWLDASIMRRHSDSFHPKQEVLQFIRKFI